MKRYVVINIGCLECGDDSTLVGVYDTQEKANKAIDKSYEQIKKRGEVGRTSPQSFEIEIDAIPYPDCSTPPKEQN